MEYGNYANTTYGSQGNAAGGGFMSGSQSDPAGSKKSYDNTLRPVTIKQLLDAQQPNQTQENFTIDNTEVTAITVVGQIRNISKQTTNVTYKLDDGTGIMEAKVWIDVEAIPQDLSALGLKEEAYARVYGRLKDFSNKRHILAASVRPIADPDEINYHLLECTYVHLSLTRGLPGQQQGNSGDGANGQSAANRVDKNLPAQINSASRKVYEAIMKADQTAEGLHMQLIASMTGLEIGDVTKACEELQGLGKIWPTIDDETWAIADYE